MTTIAAINRRRQYIDQVATIISESLMRLYEDYEAKATEQNNSNGWSFELSIPGSSNWLRLENIQLSADDLTDAIEQATESL